MTQETGRALSVLVKGEVAIPEQGIAVRDLRKLIGALSARGSVEVANDLSKISFRCDVTSDTDAFDLGVKAERVRKEIENEFLRHIGYSSALKVEVSKTCLCATR